MLENENRAAEQKGLPIGAGFRVICAGSPKARHVPMRLGLEIFGEQHGERLSNQRKLRRHVVLASLVAQRRIPSRSASRESS